MTLSGDDSQTYLLHIRSAIQSVRDYTTEGREEFLGSPVIQDAVIRQLGIIGEATKHLPPAVIGRRPEIPWKRVAGMRDILIHQYFGVDLIVAWDVVEERLTPLNEAIEFLLTDGED